MRADKLRAWMARERVGAHRFVLEHERSGEMSQIASFPAEPLPDIDHIFTVCADLADSLEESVRVSIVVMDEDGGVLGRTWHKQAPLEASSVDALGAADVSGNSIIAQLLRHIEAQQKVLTMSHGSIYTAFERTLAQMQKVVERQTAQLESLQAALRDTRVETAEDTALDQEEAQFRRAAWQKLAELGPVVADLALRAAAAKVSNGHANGHVNGTASVAA